MSIGAGLVGLPNVGKSTLFNALTKSSVPAANYPFCTIDPHVACTLVPDERTEKLKALYNSGKIIPAAAQFVDIAGLVKGAASGEGLGNQFLSHIREVDLILHVLRCFEDADITHTENRVDPIADFETIVTELILRDIDSLTKRKAKLTDLIKRSKHDPKQQKELLAEQKLIEAIEQALNDSNPVKVSSLVSTAEVETVPLLSAKKFLVIANISEDEVADDAYQNNPLYEKVVEKFGADVVIPICARLELELSQLSPEDAADMASMMGLKKTGIDAIIEKTYNNLGLITFFTCGPKEIHSWPIRQGINVREAAGEIHSDLQRGFICAEVFNCNDLFEYGSLVKLKEAGKMRTEGQDYIVKDGDIITVKFNV